MTCLDNATKEQLASLCKEKEIPVLWEEPMKHYTSFQIGGPASAVCIPKNREQLSCLLSFLRKMQINHWFVGNGSNLLISDEGLKGVVILLDSDFDGEILKKAFRIGTPVAVQEVAMNSREKAVLCVRCSVSGRAYRIGICLGNPRKRGRSCLYECWSLRRRNEGSAYLGGIS